MNQEYYIKKAIALSRKSSNNGGYPVGAIIVMDDEVVSTGLSDGKQRNDPTLHAEIDALRKASQKLQKRDLNGAIMYSSMEPCCMCLMACSWAKIEKIYFAISRKKLPSVCFEGNHDINAIAQDFYKKIGIVHLAEYEDNALSVYKQWEKFIK